MFYLFWVLLACVVIVSLMIKYSVFRLLAQRFPLYAPSNRDRRERMRAANAHIRVLQSIDETQPEPSPFLGPEHDDELAR